MDIVPEPQMNSSLRKSFIIDIAAGAYFSLVLTGMRRKEYAICCMN
jgi:hypothetical protein